MAYYRTDGHRPIENTATTITEFIGLCRGYMRVRHLSLRTEDSYLKYIRRFLEFHRKRPKAMGEAEVEAFLTEMALNGRVAAATQNVAFAALVFLYREILGIELENLSALRAKRLPRVPVVLGRDKVRRLLAQVEPPFWLVASLLYGAGLRVSYLLESGTGIRTAQDLLGHKDVRTTQMDLHTMNRPGLGIVSPLDAFAA